MTHTPKLLLTVAEAAAALGLGRSKLYQLLDAGEIESVKIGKARRVPTAALEMYVNRLQHKETSDLAEEASAGPRRPVVTQQEPAA
jgi:excisionase family DNA binding protein